MRRFLASASAPGKAPSCFQECPEGTYDDTYLIDNEKTTECKINNSYVESECIIIPKR